MSKLEGLDAAGITSWINGLDRPPLVRADDGDEPEARVEAVTETSEDTSEMSKSGHAFARASERLKSVGYKHRGEAEENESKGKKEAEASDEAMNPSDSELSAQEQEKVRELKESDTRVRAHEMAHKAAAGALAAGGPYYDLQRGPDGQNYAVGGEVPIRLPETNDYKQALKDAQQAERAALAPADPSPDDYAAAAAFRQRAVEARAKLSKEAQDDGTAKGKTGPELTEGSKQSDGETSLSSADTSPPSEVEPPVPSSFSTSEAEA